MTIGVLKEKNDDNRVGLTPENVRKLKKNNVSIVVESGAGDKSYFSDKDYESAGAEVVNNNNILSRSDVIVRINPFQTDEIDKLEKGKIVISMVSPFSNEKFIEKSLEKGITTFSLDMIPRSTRAQTMDVLSSMATTAGYKAVLEAANNLPSFFPMFMTAAGTIKPSKVLVLGAGVAGLQAIATARKLGAVVEAFDVRGAVKEEVESLGGKFIEVEGSAESQEAGGYAVEQSEDYKMKQQQLIHDHAKKADVIITTAQIPGKKAPLLVRKETVNEMKRGSVIVDLAASTGGNCELTKNDEIMHHNGIKIIGNSNYPSDLQVDASSMFGNNLINFLQVLVNSEGEINLDFEDDILKSTCVTHDYKLINKKVKEVYSSKN
jgi:NAD(P) transhydrogenase subunit alpha